MRKKHYEYIMKLGQTKHFLTSIVVNKSYYGKFGAIISGGARLCMLCDSGYFERVDRVCGIVIYNITQKGIDWKEGEEIVIVNKSIPKPKKTNAESEAKVDNKFINDELDKHYGVQEHTPPIKPTTFIGKLKYIYQIRKSL